MSTWYFPSWNGDLRLEADPENKAYTKFTMIEPTAHERSIIRKLGPIFKERKWTRGNTFWNEGGEDTQVVYVQAGIDVVGTLLVQYLKPGIATLTVVKSSDGIVTAKGAGEGGFGDWLRKALGTESVVGSTADLDAALDGRAPDEVRREEEELARRAKEAEDKKKEIDEAAAIKRSEEEAKARKISENAAPHRREADPPPKKAPKATTVKRATCCCPSSVFKPVDNTPAREVLLSFLDGEQREQYIRERRFVGVGGLSGIRYLFAHRNSPTAVKIGKCTYDLDHGSPMHFHDWTSPPEEELLAAYQILRHREPWLRNQATTMRGPSFQNPFGGGADGTHDASTTYTFGKEAADRLGLVLPPGTGYQG